MRLLEVEGPIDLGFDMSAIKDPLKESAGLATKISTNTLGSQQRSQLKTTLAGNELRKSRAKDSVEAQEFAQTEDAINAIVAKVSQAMARTGMSKAEALRKLTIREPFVRKEVIRRLTDM